MEKYIPKSTADKCAIMFFITGGHFFFWYEVFQVLPHYYPDKNFWTFEVFVQCIIAAVIYINCFGNLCKMVLNRSELTTSMLKTSSDMSSMERLQMYEAQGWVYCSHCMQYAPPRSHHCKVCKICVLRRDHHCWFAGQCVGFLNHRYYIGVIFYAWFAALYGLVFNVWFTGDMLYGCYTLSSMLCITCPHITLLLGWLSPYQMLVASVAFINHLFLVMLTWIITIQLRQLLTGQTQYERQKSIKTYDCGLRHNIRELLGNHWYITLISPFLPSQLHGSGIYSISTSEKHK